MTTTKCVLQAAAPDTVSLEHLPVLPPWWPLDPQPTEDQPAPVPLSPEARRQARAQAAMTEARRGPCDGQRGEVEVLPTGPPELLRFYDGGWAYRLVEAESRPGWAVYRYSPADSPQHANTMAAVVEGYVETGPEYVAGLRLEQAQHQGVTAERIS